MYISRMKLICNRFHLFARAIIKPLVHIWNCRFLDSAPNSWNTSTYVLYYDPIHTNFQQLFQDTAPSACINISRASQSREAKSGHHRSLRNLGDIEMDKFIVHAILLRQIHNIYIGAPHTVQGSTGSSWCCLYIHTFFRVNLTLDRYTSCKTKTIYSELLCSLLSKFNRVLYIISSVIQPFAVY